MAAPLRFADYNTQQGRMDSAIRDVFGIGQQANTQYEADMARKQFGIQGVTGLGSEADRQYQSAYQRKLDAIGSQFQAGQQQWNNITNLTQQLSDAYKASLMPSMTLREIGLAQEDLRQRQLADQERIFREQQQQPWKQIGLYNAALPGVGGGQQTVVATPPPQPSPVMSGLGGALAGSMFGPIGMVGGGILGYMGGSGR
jgi:hypothetical protein